MVTSTNLADIEAENINNTSFYIDIDTDTDHYTIEFLWDIDHYTIEK